MKKYILFLLCFYSLYSMNTAFAFVETDIDNYTSMVVGCTGGSTYPFTINTSNNEMLIVNVVFSVGFSSLYTLTYDGVRFTDTQASLVDGYTAIQQWFLPHPHMGTHDIVITFANSGGCLASTAIAVNNLDLNPVVPLNYTNSIASTPIVLFTQTITSTSTNSFLNWTITAQSGATITGELDTVPYSQPEVLAFGSASLYNKYGSNPVNTSLSVSSPSQLYRGLLVEYPSAGGGGGTGSTTQDYTYTNGGITTNDIFNMGSTTVNFGTVDYTACDVSSITIDPFASSSLSWGTFNIPQCILQSFKLLLFGTDGFDTYNVIHFVNNSSSTLPFLMFKFMGGSLIYINPLTGALKDLPNATSSMIFNIPLFSTTTPVSLDLNASSSILNTIKLPEAIDKTASTIEIAVFFVMWAIIFRYINI
jgi:hypothetical protein